MSERSGVIVRPYLAIASGSEIEGRPELSYIFFVYADVEFNKLFFSQILTNHQNGHIETGNPVFNSSDLPEVLKMVRFYTENFKCKHKHCLAFENREYTIAEFTELFEDWLKKYVRHDQKNSENDQQKTEQEEN